jgi:hypothetical protein
MRKMDEKTEEQFKKELLELGEPQLKNGRSGMAEFIIEGPYFVSI